ncbi:hypothetical protein [Actinomadura sp. 3N508]|uniref:hypothetical protein n=1 Tax=Actinomadura sp. 3N508 TaxID=3375153 RepID=UPI00378F485B
MTMTLDELAPLFGRETLERAIARGHIEADGDRVTHWSRRQLDATLTLVRAGVPLEDVLSAGRELQRSMDDLAAMFVRMIAAHAAPGNDGDDGRGVGELAETIARLRPGAQITVEAGFARAMDRQVRAAIDQAIGRLAG